MQDLDLSSVTDEEVSRFRSALYGTNKHVLTYFGVVSDLRCYLDNDIVARLFLGLVRTSFRDCTLLVGSSPSEFSRQLGYSLGDRVEYAWISLESPGKYLRLQRSLPPSQFSKDL